MSKEIRVVENVRDLEDGVYVIGMYTGMREFPNQDGTKTLRVSVLSGDAVHQIYVEQEYIHEFFEHDTKEDLMMSARPAVNKKGFLAWYGGKVIQWLDEDEAEASAAS